MKARRKGRGIILRDGKPSATTSRKGKTQEASERQEDMEDLRELMQVRNRPLKFRRLEDLLREYSPPT